jgi:hypothetical protein
MCFPLVVVRAALFALRSYPLVIVLEVLLPVLLPAARTSDNRDASDAATIRTAASARNKPQHGSPPAPQMMTTAGAKISPFDVAKETVQANVSYWVISRPHALTHAKSASPSKAKVARGHRAPGEAAYRGAAYLSLLQ